MNKVSVCIVGAGISGLHTAYELAQQGVSFRLFEAKKQLGGRIQSQGLHQQPDGTAHGCSELGRFDIGPSWFWPGQQQIESLVSELGLNDSVYQQYAQGDAVYEPISGPVQRGIGGISMAGSYRLKGGLQALIERLEMEITEQAGSESIVSNTGIQSIELSDEGVAVSDGKSQWLCEKVILAMPPRVAINNIGLSPKLESERVQELNKVATWMAGHAKAVVVYDTPFWRQAGLSGDIISQKGPLAEIHDASLDHADEFALFGFFATPPQHRSTDKNDVDQKIIAQLTRLMGEAAANPKAILYKDWARDNLVATELDQHIPNHHPSNFWSTKVEPGWQGRLIWSGTESAAGHYNGYIEGALLASENALELC